MDLDSTTLIYIVAIILYFLYTTFMRKKEPEIGPEEEDRPEAEPRKTVSFEDLLKDIRREQMEREQEMESAGQEKQKTPTPKPVPAARVPEEKPEKKYQEPQYPTHEERPYGQKHYETQDLVKLDDQVDLEDTARILGEVEDVSEEYSVSNRYADLLKNPKSVRDAIVVSEILQRKHF